MSRLASLSSNFVFNLPTDFIPPETEKRFSFLLEKNHIYFENILDYINSTILDVEFPGIQFSSPKQTIKRGKQIRYKPATNVQDILDGDSITITFLSVDNDINYMIVRDALIKHYLDTTFVKYIEPFEIKIVDQERDVLFKIQFRELIFESIGSNKLSYNSIPGGAKTFTCTFTFNWYDIADRFSSDGGELLSLGSFQNPATNPLYNPSDNPEPNLYT